MPATSCSATRYSQDVVHNMSAADIAALAASLGTPFYVYNRHVIAEQVQRLRTAFADFTILYSLKCNPHPDICRFLAAQGLGLDAASQAEALHGAALGLPSDMVLYSAPGKSVADLERCLSCSTIVADSWTELARLEACAARRHVTVTAGLRVSAGCCYARGQGPDLKAAGPDKFGVEEESLAAHADALRSLRHVRVRGLHVHVRSQVLNAAALAGCFAHVGRLALAWTQDLCLPLDFVNFGGGLGIPYGAEQPLDLESLGARVQAMVRELRNTLGSAMPRLYLESGRFLVGAAGLFVTRIVDIKESRGCTYVIAEGLFNHFLRASMAAFMAGLPLPDHFTGPCEPLWSGPGQHVPMAIGTPAPARTVRITGNLCTAHDLAVRDLALANMVEGNLLVFPNAGAYGAAISPHGFGSHAPVQEVVWPGEH